MTMATDYDQTLKHDLVDAFANAVIGLTAKGQMAEVVDATIELATARTQP